MATKNTGLVSPPRTAASTAASAPPPKTSGEDAFIAGAPDAKPKKVKADKPDRPPRGKKTPISLTLKQELLDAVDARAAATGQSRAGWIGLAIYKALKQED